MPLKSIGVVSREVNESLSATYSSVMGASESVQQYVADQIEAWEHATGSALNKEFPLLSHELKLADWQKRLQSSPPASLPAETVDDYVAFSKVVGRPPNEQFWRRQFNKKAHQAGSLRKPADEIATSARLLLAEWRKQMDGARAEWELHELALRRARLMDELDKTLQSLKDLQKSLCELGLETGVLLDLSKSSLTPQLIEQFRRWALYLAEDKEIRALCDMLGKMRQIDLSETIERVTSTAPVHVDVQNINSREEIVGIRLGKDIEHVLPSELALLADPETALLFDLKYVESSLMCFDMEGLQRMHRHIETEEDRSIQDATKRGPMIICIDTSGSMNGIPETIAKAVALFLATKSREERRPCYLVNFSTNISTLDFSAGIGMEALLRFLRMSFHGGTDVAPALAHALEKMEEKAYANADLLVVSDFIMSELPEPCLKRIEDQRLLGNRFHSLVVSECYMLKGMKGVFDNEWVFDPRHGRIQELVSFQRGLHVTDDQ